LQVASALARPDSRPYGYDHEIYVYQRDLLGPFGITVDRDLMEKSSNIGLTALTEGVLRPVRDRVADPDLLVLAYALPDMCSFKTVSAHLNYLLGGRSRSFAVSEQGLCSPFTALRIAAAYARSGRCDSLALFVCDQTTLPYRDPLVHDTPLADSAALLYFDGQDGYELCGIGAAARGQGVAELVTALAGPGGGSPEPALAVLGPWADTVQLAGTGLAVRQCEPGTYCTSVWLELARHHEAWLPAYPTLLLCDTDPRTGRSQAALFRRRRAAGPARPAAAEETAP
jgi:hypothetical protein